MTSPLAGLSGGNNDSLVTTTTTATSIISVSDAARLHEGHVRVQGIISAMSPLRKLIKSCHYRCLNCNTLNEGRCSKFADGKPPLYQEIKKPIKCINCSEKDFDTAGECKFINAIIIELRDADTFSDIDPLHAVLFDGDTKDAYTHIGERATVTGQIHTIEQDFSKHRFASYLYVESIEYESNRDITITKNDEEAIERFTLNKEKFALLKGNSILDILADMVAPEIIKYNHAKKGILLSAASTGTDLKQKKVNVAFVGDPGLAKSTLLRKAVKLVPNSRYESGQNSSGKSLTAIVAREDENYVLRTGPIPAAKGAICAINEIGRMYFDDQKHLLDVMQEQFFTINKYGISGTISSPTAIIASANPINGEWKDPEKIDLDEFPALKPLIDRFDLIYPFRNTRDEEVIREYADKRFDLDDKLIPDYTAYLQKHIEYSKRFNPRLSEEAKIMLKEYYISIAKSYGSPRIRETVVTIAKMIARLKLKDIVDVEDARETMQFYNVILLQLEQVVNITTDLRDEAFEECIEVLKKSPFALSFSELIKSACQSNEQVKGYIGDKYELTHNIKLRPILELLLNDSHIIQTNLKPVALQWTETGRKRNTGSNSNLYDAYDVYDTQINTANENNSQDSILKENNNVLYSDNKLQEESSRTLKNNSEDLTTPTSYASYTSYSGASGVHSDTSVDTNVPTSTNENIIQPIVSVEEFFYDNPDLPYVPLPEHTLKQSPCAPIIGSRMEGGLEWYYCKLHQKSKNINLSSIEQHCKYDSPEIHKSEVIRLYIKHP